jgi:RimJ/RimL family protein N-acetyltransferase
MGDSKDPEEQCKAWFDRVFNRYQNNLGGMNALIDKQTNKLIGQCGLLVQTVDGVEELEIGYSMMPEFRGMGYASEASQKCKAYAFEHHLADSIISIIHIDNIDSANVALKNGMKPEKQTLFRNMEANIFRVYKP